MRHSIKTLGSTDLYKRIVELEGEIIDLCRDNHHLVQRNAELEAQLQTQRQHNLRRTAGGLLAY